MKWVKSGDYAIESGEWTICKGRVGGQWRYSLYRDKKLMGVYATAETAKEAITEKANG